MRPTCPPTRPAQLAACRPRPVPGHRAAAGRVDAGPSSRRRAPARTRRPGGRPGRRPADSPSPRRKPAAAAAVLRAAGWRVVTIDASTPLAAGLAAAAPVRRSGGPAVAGAYGAGPSLGRRDEPPADAHRGGGRVLAQSFSLLTVISGLGWLYAGSGAVVVVAGGRAGHPARRDPGRRGGHRAHADRRRAAAGRAGAGRGGSAGWRIVAVVAASAGVRRVLPALAGAGTYLAALLLYLNLVFASAQSLAWISRRRGSLRHLASAGLGGLRRAQLRAAGAEHPRAWS